MRRIYNLFSLIAALVLIVACNKEEDLSSSIVFSADSELSPVFGPDGGSKTFTFDTEYGWSVQSFDEWVTVTPDRGTALQKSFTITVESHDSGYMRESHVLVRLSNTHVVKIPITQQMRDHYDVEPTEAYLVEAAGGNLFIDIDTNIEYIVDVPATSNWIKFSEAQTRNMRAEKLCFDVESNNSRKSRIALITARDARDRSALYTFTVVQSVVGEALNEIVYTSDNNNRIEPNTTEGFGDKLSLHLFDGLQGRLIFRDDVTVIPDGAFAGKSDIAYIRIPDAVERIGAEAFKDCSSLNNVTLPESLLEIGRQAFAGCQSFTAVTLPESVNSIEGSAFEGCAGVITTNCVIANQAQEYDASHWFYGANFEKVVVNNKLGARALHNCLNVKQVEFLAGCKYVASKAFENCAVERAEAESLDVWCSITFESSTANPLYTGECELVIGAEKLTKLNTTASIEKIVNYSFYNYQALESVHIGDSVTAVGAEAFGKCQLESLYLGKGIKSLSKSFAECKAECVTINFNLSDSAYNATKSNHWFYGLSANKIVLGEDVTNVGKLALSALDVKEIVVGNAVTNIDEGAFAQSPELVSVTLGSAVEKLGQHVFFECPKLAEVVLPESIVEIGDYCFHNCTALASVYVKSTTPPAIGSYVFNNVDTIYVPVASLEAYIAADGWKSYKDKIQGYSF